MKTDVNAAPAVIRSSSLTRTLEVNPLTCSIGAELSNVHLGAAAEDEGLMAEIRQALLKHRVIFFRDQDITRAEHVAFARKFGELEDHPVVGSHPDHPGLVQIYKTPDSPIDRNENSWHTDATWRDQPPMGCVLRCVECPPVGGDTMWANMALAYERLPEHIKTQIAGLRARHSIEASFGAAMPVEKRLALHAQFPDAEHPVVRTHPETGRKALFVSEHFTTRILGLPEADSRALLDELFALSTRPEHVYRHAWQPHDMVFWDNRSVIHLAAGTPDHLRRKLYRTTIEGDVPY